MFFPLGRKYTRTNKLKSTDLKIVLLKTIPTIKYTNGPTAEDPCVGYVLSQLRDARWKLTVNKKTEELRNCVRLIELMKSPTIESVSEATEFLLSV